MVEIPPSFSHRLPVDPSGLKSAIEECRKSLLPKKEENRKRWVELAEKVLKNETISLTPPPHQTGVDRLGDKYPHMKGALQIVRDFLDISRLAEGPSSLPPLLLAGPPGAGKTAFALDLAKALGVPSRVVNSASLTHSFVLGGIDAVWGSAKEGVILNLLLEGSGNPVMILDEIDKAGKRLSGSSHSASIEDFLLNVLEPVTARRYTDEFLSSAHPVDASKVQWLFTANDLKGLSKPLLSRLTVIPVQEPTPEELRKVIIPSLYRDILEEYGLSGKAPESLSEEAVESISGSPREARKRILRLLAGYARDGKFEALEAETPGTEKRIGFNAGGRG
uniref:AAA ATPase, central domain protein n=1 Tax=Leptospirillum ferrodiazotrophum TaxID=412449 RepID=C6HZD7_9BACT|nr:MAG: AAA ATPase, central domain protein [Leptospirillum ferrodiazotrophum]